MKTYSEIIEKADVFITVSFKIKLAFLPQFEEHSVKLSEKWARATAVPQLAIAGRCPLLSKKLTVGNKLNQLK
jgi:hypothetical protein